MTGYKYCRSTLFSGAGNMLLVDSLLQGRGPLCSETVTLLSYYNHPRLAEPRSCDHLNRLGVVSPGSDPHHMYYGVTQLFDSSCFFVIVLSAFVPGCLPELS